MTEIIVSASTETWTIRLPDPNDRWDIGDTGGRVTGVAAWIARDFEQGCRWYWGASWSGFLDVEIGDLVYAVVADYESGSTFGRDGGHAKVVDVFTNIEAADELADLAEASAEYNFAYNGKEYHAPWHGYFESLNEVRVWPVRVKE